MQQQGKSKGEAALAEFSLENAHTDFCAVVRVFTWLLVGPPPRSKFSKSHTYLAQCPRRKTVNYAGVIRTDIGRAQAKREHAPQTGPKGEAVIDTRLQRKKERERECSDHRVPGLMCVKNVLRTLRRLLRGDFIARTKSFLRLFPFVRVEKR